MAVSASTTARSWRLLLVLALLLSVVGSQPAPDPALAAPAVTSDNLVPGGVTAFTADGPLVYYVGQPGFCPPGPAPATTISRTRVSGWEPRVVFSRIPAPGDPCPYQIYSNIVADSTYLYWVDTSGVMRFPIAGSPTATPQTLLSLYSPGAVHELAISDTYLWGYTGGNLWGMELANPSHNFAIGYTGPETSTNLLWDGKYLYMIRGPSRLLQRYTPDGAVKTIDSGVTTYAPVGEEVRCPTFPCVTHQYVYYVKQGVENAIQRYDSADNSYFTPYVASPPPGLVARIYALTAGASRFVNSIYSKDLFFFEKQWVPCNCFETSSTDFLRRLNLGAGPGVTLDYRLSTTSWSASNLLNTDVFLLWKDITAPNPDNAGGIQRLAMDAASLPSINMRITGYQITQGVQTPDNSVFLIRNRVTYFRLFVKSDGADVPAVTARLNASWDSHAQDSIAPLRPLVTVRGYYPDQGLTNGFLFVLPREWLLHNDLRLEPVLNPTGVPLEPNFNDNRLSSAIGPFTIYDNPQARLHVVRMSYNWNNVNYTANDYNAIVSWWYRAYPIAVDPGGVAAGDQVITNNDLGKRVRDYTNTKECNYLLTTKIVNNTKVTVDNRNLCASYFLNDQLAALRRDGVLPKSAYIYASVVGLGRGSASGKDPVANGPDEIANGFTFDTAGFYAGHETGHLLGRGHPKEMSDDPKTPLVEGCGHSPDDDKFPYLFDWIGSNDNQVSGFDSGVGTPTGANRYYPYYGVHEVMGYCGIPNQWLSDYTYMGMFTFLQAHPGPAAANPAGAGPARPLAGDWLDISGRFTPGGPAEFTYARRLDSIAEAPALTPGGYTLRLVDGSGAALANHPFTPEQEVEVSDWYSFGLVIPFAAGARQVQLVEDATGQVLASLPISSSRPQVSAVELPQAQPPLHGTATVTWNASDPDGEPLTYDLLYSVDGGISFQPVQLGLTVPSASLDTASLPGGMNGIFRVVASDGVQTASADSAPIQVAVKAPEVHLLTPADQQHVQYGTPLLLTGYALDAQDGAITADGSLTWTSQDGLLGYGPNLTVSNLPTGVNTVTLTALNSTGLSSSASVTVVVGDDLYAQPPSLAASPTEITLQSPGQAPTPQTAPLVLVNAGGPANMDWTASSDQPWLSLSSVSGSLPYTLTVTADPRGLEPNGTYTGSVTVSAGGQSVNVPVTLQTGLGSYIAPLLPRPKLFLPFVYR